MKKQTPLIVRYKTLRGLFNNPERWCKGHMAKNTKGYSTSSGAKDAVQFCLLGGIERVYGNGPKARLVNAKLTELISKQSKRKTSIVGFNDRASTSYKKLIGILRKAWV